MSEVSTERSRRGRKKKGGGRDWKTGKTTRNLANSLHEDTDSAPATAFRSCENGESMETTVGFINTRETVHLLCQCVDVNISHSCISPPSSFCFSLTIGNRIIQFLDICVRPLPRLLISSSRRLRSTENCNAYQVSPPHRCQCLIAGVSHDYVVSSRNCVFSYIEMQTSVAAYTVQLLLNGFDVGLFINDKSETVL